MGNKKDYLGTQFIDKDYKIEKYDQFGETTTFCISFNSWLNSY